MTIGGPARLLWKSLIRIGTPMTKTIILVPLLAAAVSISFAQTAAPDPAASSAAASKKHKWIHAPKLRKGATAASNPETSPDKKGGA